MVQLVTEYPLLRFGILLGLFALVAVGVYFAFSAVVARQLSRRRLVDGTDYADRAVISASLRSQNTESAWLKLVNGIEKAGLSLVDTRDDSLRQEARRSRVHGPLRASCLHASSGCAHLRAPAPRLRTDVAGRAQCPAFSRLYLIVVVAALAGLYLPSVFIAAKADRRQRDIINGFPDALDLMLVCVEAGLGMDAAFARVGMEMADSHPRLAEQFGAVVLELRAGRSHEDALRRMADRAGVEEIRAFATLLIQSSKLGSSIAQTLRVYAAEMREQRRMRAEEKAHRLPVLLSVPLVGCMLPVMIGVLMLPAVIQSASDT